MTNFGRELKAQRAACGLSQAQAAACFRDLSVRTLQAWETQEQSPPLWVQHVILERLSKRKPLAGRGGVGGRKRVAPKRRKAPNDLNSATGSAGQPPQAGEARAPSLFAGVNGSANCKRRVRNEAEREEGLE